MSSGSKQGGSSSGQWFEPVEIFILGRARPAGSKRAVASRVFADNPHVMSWMQEVRSAADKAMQGRALIDKPVCFSACFYFARPKSHYGSGRNASELKPSAPEHMVHKPDLTKLVRAAEDALTKTVWTDDSLVCRFGVIQKRYSDDGREFVTLLVEPAL